MKEITDKTWGLHTRSFGTIWLTEAEAIQAQQAYKAGAEYLEFDDLLVSKGDIAGFARGERLMDMERRRAGEFECPNHPGNWIPKGNRCGLCGR